ncbi:hypothetical protein N9B20_03840 [Mariniblastus sp.]|nr:hypothetical protein [Mariniblastus sp.]
MRLNTCAGQYFGVTQEVAWLAVKSAKVNLWLARETFEVRLNFFLGTSMKLRRSTGVERPNFGLAV